MGIAENIRRITEKLPPAVRLVAVSKFHPLENILEAYSAGQRVFAESRPQEFHAKIREISLMSGVSPVDGAGGYSAGVGSDLTVKPYGDIQWHFIGHLQTNKLKMVLPYVSLVQSVDSERLLRAIDLWGRDCGRVTNVLLECHISAEQSKQGFSDEEVVELLSGVGEFPCVRVCGLMGMATFTDDEAVVRADFQKIASLFDRLKGGLMVGSPDFKELSIGMSDDYEIALEYGATMVRIGTALFGPRVY